MEEGVRVAIEQQTGQRSERGLKQEDANASGEQVTNSTYERVARQIIEDQFAIALVIRRMEAIGAGETELRIDVRVLEEWRKIDRVIVKKSIAE